MDASLIKKMYAEAIGTFLLIFIIECSGGNAFAVGGIIWIVMIITRFVSGALINPAVTVSVMIKRFLMKDLTSSETREYIYYAIIQFVFGTLGALSAWALTSNSLVFDFKREYPEYKAFVCEAFYTSVLCINALMIGKSKHGMYCEGLVVCITVVTGAKTIGHLTKNCLNPAVGVGMNVVSYIATGKGLENMWVYIVSPMTGGIIAGILSFVYDEIRDDKKLRRTTLFFKVTGHKDHLH